LRKRLLAFLLAFLLLLSPNVLAHSGKTDANGGHYDRSTGEYHYHHGYPAHQHYDMDGDGVADCPYDFDDKTDHSSHSGSSSRSDSGSSHAVQSTPIPLDLGEEIQVSFPTPIPTQPVPKHYKNNRTYSASDMLKIALVCLAFYAWIPILQIKLKIDEKKEDKRSKK